MDSHEEKQKNLTVNKVFNTKTIKKGVIYFVIITLISLTAIFLYTSTGKTLEVWSSIDFGFLLLALGFAFVDLFIGGWRNHIFAREFVKGISQWVCFKANLANMFMGAVTPSQSGGGPAQWYILYRNSLKMPELISISVINFISTITFFPLSGYLAYLVLKDRLDQEIVVHIVKVCFIVFAVIAVLFFISMVFPKVIGKFLRAIGSLLSVLKSSLKQRMDSFGEKIEKALKEWQVQSYQLLKKKPWLLLYSFILTNLLYLNKYALAYIIILAFGYDADFLVVISIQAIVYFLAFFAPSPGASGIAELSLATLMASVLSSEYIASFTLLYRSILVFLPAILGSYVVIKQLNLEAKQ